MTIAVTGKVSTEVVGASEEKSEMKFHSGSGPVEIQSARADAGVARASRVAARADAGGARGAGVSRAVEAGVHESEVSSRGELMRLKSVMETERYRDLPSCMWHLR